MTLVMSGAGAAILAAEEGEQLSRFVAQESAVVFLLAIAALVTVIASRLRFPFTVALVVVGLFASVLGELVAVDISAEVILFLLVPPLLFEATLNLPWPKLRADLFPILMFALIGTAVGTLAIGALVHWTVAVPWTAAFAFGALISATDPVAVIALFKTLGAPKRLAILVEGESLFNDAVAVVAFGLAVTAAAGSEPFTLGNAINDFLVVSAGGLGIGLILGYLVSSVFLARVDDPLVETSITLALAYGSFLLAEEFGIVVGRELHFSGILAVVASGLMVGNVGMHNTSPSTRLTLDNFWELLTFLVNSMVFLVIGLAISLEDLADHFVPVVVAIIGVLVLRILLIHALAAIASWAQPSRRVPGPYRNVMIWAGLRGAISLALVLTVDNTIFDDETVTTLQIMTYGVVLFTLLIQGTTISVFMERLGLTSKIDTELTQQRHQARIYMSRAGQSEMARLGADGVLFNDMATSLGRTYQRAINDESARLRSHFSGHPELEVSMLLQARRDALVVERSALNEILFSGLIDSQVAHDLTIELDNRMAALDLLEERWESDPLPTFSGTDDGESDNHGR
ncbi:MAG: Na+/H+ antiporter [Acidimicrobiia bacterium]|nr:Na+/H+ antiporter [Acidimicrobiia bacterium]